MKTILTAIFFTLIATFAFANNDGQTGETPFSAMSAVLVVGPQEDGTAAAMRKMDKVAAVFEKQGVTVHRFYDKNANWEEIKAVSSQANFFVYSGHGSSSCGLTLQTRVSSQDIQDELQLAKNAIVIFKSVCRGAGSSAGDDGDIGIKEATARVTDYALPFFEIGASAYYANNLGDGCTEFLENFFAGKTIKTCFEESAETWTNIELRRKYLHDPAKQIAIASTDWGGTAIRTTYINGKKTVEEIPAVKSYEIAYVGESGLTVWDLVE